MPNIDRMYATHEAAQYSELEALSEADMMQSALQEMKDVDGKIRADSLYRDYAQMQWDGIPEYNIAQNFVAYEMISEMISHNVKTACLPLSHEDALRLIESGSSDSVRSNFQKFSGLTQEVASALLQEVIEEGWENETGMDIVKNLESFSNVDFDSLIDKLFEAGEEYAIPEHLEKFAGVDHKKLAKRLIEAGSGWDVAQYFNKFQGVDPRETALALIAHGERESAAVAVYFKDFSGLDANEFAFAIIKQGGLSGREALAKHLEDFEVDHNKIATAILTSDPEDGWRTMIRHFEHFKSLDYLTIVKLQAFAAFHPDWKETLEKKIGKMSGKN